LTDEQLVARRIVDDPEHDAVLGLEADRDAEDGETVRIVRGAVEGIDDPAPARAAGGDACLLRRDRVVAEGLLPAPEERGCGASIRLGERMRRRALVGGVAGAGELIAEQMAGRARGIDGHAELERWHASRLYHTRA